MSPGVRRAIRWTAAGIAGLFVILTLPLVGLFGSGYLRNFHVPAEGMAPTLEKGDRFVALMDGAGDLKRGDVVLLAVDEAIYVKRVAALGKDTIGVSGGIVVLNGRPVAQRFVAREQRPGYAGMEPARRLAEQLPGETAPHEILDMGWSDVDDFPEMRVPAGFVFVLGDNRDRSADSRVSRVSAGVELLPVGNVKGRPLFCTAGCDLSR